MQRLMMNSRAIHIAALFCGAAVWREVVPLANHGWLEVEAIRAAQAQVTYQAFPSVPVSNRESTLALIDVIRQTIVAYATAARTPVSVSAVSTALSLLGCEAVRVH